MRLQHLKECYEELYFLRSLNLSVFREDWPHVSEEDFNKISKAVLLHLSKKDFQSEVVILNSELISINNKILKALENICSAINQHSS